MPKLSSQRLSTIEIFFKASEIGSFARTAEVLGLNPSAVSKSVLRLEQRLGIKLFHRTTRSLQLTQEGQVYFERCQQVLEEISAAEALITQGISNPRGRLRVSLPAAYSTFVLAPRLYHFFQQYSDSSLMVRPLRSDHTLTVASPSHLQQHGIPKSLQDLHHHNCFLSTCSCF